MMKIKAVLIDLNGTLHIGDSPIIGCIEALNKLKRTGCFIRFVTNTTKESSTCLYNRLTNLGFDVNKEHIYSSLRAASDLISKRNLKPLMLVSKEAIEDFNQIDLHDKNHNCVLVGLAPEEFYYDKMNEAFRLLRKGAPLIAIHTGKYFQRSDGIALGPGCFVKGLEYSAQIVAEVVGKPNSNFFNSAISDHNILPNETVMIGDDITDDVEGALKSGMNGILVQTGKYRMNDEDKIYPLKPTVVVSSFVEAVDWLLKENLIRYDNC